jgi:hypothetical protein
LSDPSELLALRIALLGIIFVFLLVAAFSLKSTLGTRVRREVRTMSPLAQLVIDTPSRTGLARGSAFDLAGDTTLGRDEANGIVLSDPSVSAQHAAIERTARGWLVRDLGSTNGTSVGSRAVDGGGAMLRSGDELRIGAVRFRFHS